MIRTRLSLLPFLLFFLVLILAALACSSSSNPPVVISTPLEDSISSSPQPNNDIPELGTSRLNPAPYEAEILSDGMIFSVGEVIRPADQIVREADMFSSTPEDGIEYILVQVRIKCAKSADETCSLTSFDFKLVDSAGKIIDNEWLISGIERQLVGSQLFGGALSEGYLVFLIDQTEEHPILMYDPLLGNRIFLSISYQLVP